MEDRSSSYAAGVSSFSATTSQLVNNRRCITYMLQSIDKTTLGYAALFGVRDETHLTGPEYSWLGSLFYLGYLAWEFPTGMLLQRLPIAKFMSVTVILWGIVLMCHAAADDFAGLAAARTFLGERKTRLPLDIVLLHCYLDFVDVGGYSKYSWTY